MKTNTAKRDVALATAFTRLLCDRTEDGGALLRWDQRKYAVILPMLRSDLISDEAFKRLVDQRIGRVQIEKASITRTGEKPFEFTR